MPEGVFDVPRQPESRPAGVAARLRSFVRRKLSVEPPPSPQEERKVKPGDMVIVRLPNGALQDGWMAHIPQEGRVVASKMDNKNGIPEKITLSVEELHDLNRNVDPFRAGAWGISVTRSDGRIDDGWTSRGINFKTGLYELEKPDGKGGRLVKSATPKQLRKINS